MSADVYYLLLLTMNVVYRARSIYLLLYVFVELPTFSRSQLEFIRFQRNKHGTEIGITKVCRIFSHLFCNSAIGAR